MNSSVCELQQGEAVGQASLVLPIQAARDEADVAESIGASAVRGRHGFNTEPRPKTNGSCACQILSPYTLHEPLNEQSVCHENLAYLRRSLRTTLFAERR
ncbi:hypothetical protein RBWH47_03612 [Rhodopirellula baltica WH47]|uniref:Uncharacterized protein n=1 Tax=Rhodopirellula baltica WH47 TaxID=991778 RepID=F2AXX8_RHOBT|nr:hypothetical protein RBWH47_03612 [Rhodopirellula baltica WH47]